MPTPDQQTIMLARLGLNALRAHLVAVQNANHFNRAGRIKTMFEAMDYLESLLKL